MSESDFTISTTPDFIMSTSKPEQVPLPKGSDTPPVYTKTVEEKPKEIVPPPKDKSDSENDSPGEAMAKALKLSLQTPEPETKPALITDENATKDLTPSKPASETGSQKAKKRKERERKTQGFAALQALEKDPVTADPTKMPEPEVEKRQIKLITMPETIRNICAPQDIFNCTMSMDEPEIIYIEPLKNKTTHKLELSRIKLETMRLSSEMSFKICVLRHMFTYGIFGHVEYALPQKPVKIEVYNVAYRLNLIGAMQKPEEVSKALGDNIKAIKDKPLANKAFILGVFKHVPKLFKEALPAGKTQLATFVTKVVAKVNTGFDWDVIAQVRPYYCDEWTGEYEALLHKLKRHQGWRGCFTGGMAPQRVVASGTHAEDALKLFNKIIALVQADAPELPINRIYSVAGSCLNQVNFGKSEEEVMEWYKKERTAAKQGHEQDKKLSLMNKDSSSNAANEAKLRADLEALKEKMKLQEAEHKAIVQAKDTELANMAKTTAPKPDMQIRQLRAELQTERATVMQLREELQENAKTIHALNLGGQKPAQADDVKPSKVKPESAISEETEEGTEDGPVKAWFWPKEHSWYYNTTALVVKIPVATVYAIGVVLLKVIKAPYKWFKTSS
ncbi:hypothetical protein [Rhizoctonia solani fusarivirus 2]|uniref:Uncharacterized protein n=1 Tax=Rhizoctonia solani fusarivirus 2 TaxID=2599954 RepID=A0AAE6HWM3_9VIRU|nr:hypothetical protein QKQ62_gp4 [Rhizoctonia solani fusarivirus 2]QDW92692.1 hypothetical protein [Rhizoctonia solani fusarivirus 2]